MYFNREVEFNRRCSQFTRDTRISDGHWMRLRAWLLPVREAQSAVTIWTARRESTGEEKHTTTAKKCLVFSTSSAPTRWLSSTKFWRTTRNSQKWSRRWTRYVIKLFLFCSPKLASDCFFSVTVCFFFSLCCASLSFTTVQLPNRFRPVLLRISPSISVVNRSLTFMEANTGYKSLTLEDEALSQVWAHWDSQFCEIVAP